MVMVSTHHKVWRVTVCVHEMVCRLSHYDDGIVCFGMESHLARITRFGFADCERHSCTVESTRETRLSTAARWGSSRTGLTGSSDRDLLKASERGLGPV